MLKQLPWLYILKQYIFQQKCQIKNKDSVKYSIPKLSVPMITHKTTPFSFYQGIIKNRKKSFKILIIFFQS